LPRSHRLLFLGLVGNEVGLAEVHRLHKFCCHAERSLGFGFAGAFVISEFERLLDLGYGFLVRGVNCE
jgi:hypothetical protein